METVNVQITFGQGVELGIAIAFGFAIASIPLGIIAFIVAACLGL